MQKLMKIMLGLFFSASTLVSQTQEKQSAWEQAADRGSPLNLKGEEKADQKVSGIPMEGAVDPSKYIVGPSDLFILVFWGAPPVEYTVPVTPEGTLLIPTVGEIRVSDESLADARKRVLEAVAKKYPHGGFSVTLLRPRQ